MLNYQKILLCKVNKVKYHKQLQSNKHLLPKVTIFNKCKVNKVKCQLQISEALKSVALLPTECAQSVGGKATLRKAPRSHPYKGLNRCARKAAPTQPMLELCQNMLDATYSSLCVETVVSDTARVNKCSHTIDWNVVYCSLPGQSLPTGVQWSKMLIQFIICHLKQSFVSSFYSLLQLFKSLSTGTFVCFKGLFYI